MAVVCLDPGKRLPNYVDLLQKAVTSVLTDEGFKVPSAHAEAAVSCGNTLLAAWREKEENVNSFAAKLTTQLLTCFKTGRSLQVRKESMWKAYHQLRTTPAFSKLWKDFLKEFSLSKAEPSFYQFITDKLFAELIEHEFPLTPAASNQEKNQENMTSEERMALRYVAGYVCRKVRKDIEDSSDLQKDDMIFCVFNLSGDASDDEDTTEAWVNAIDRGGLWHISDETYALFEKFEQNIRHVMTVSNLRKMDSTSKEKIIDGIIKDEDVLFDWCILSVESSDTVASKVLKKLVELYVKVRGFSYAATCLEMYKQSKRKTLQRAKGLRKELFTSKAS